MRYTAWGQTRYTWTASGYAWGSNSVTNAAPTTDRFTGQRQEYYISLYWFGSRWYDQSLGRFIQPDSIIPNTYDPQSYDRYSYVRNNPVNRVDPSGHRDNCNFEDRQCVIDYGWTLDVLKQQINANYGMSLADTGSSHGNGTGPKAWDYDSAKQVYHALEIIDDKLNGHLISLIGGSTFTLNGYEEGHYHGKTGTGYIDFMTGGSFPSPYINIFHEVGHLVDANSAGGNHFSTALTNANHTWIAQDGKIDMNILYGYVGDPFWSSVNYPPQDPLQGTNYSGTTPDEQWADTFANYVAGNINLGESAGKDMDNFTSLVLAPWTR